jgi:hypothetical protein
MLVVVKNSPTLSLLAGEELAKRFAGRITLEITKSPDGRSVTVNILGADPKETQGLELFLEGKKIAPYEADYWVRFPTDNPVTQRTYTFEIYDDPTGPTAARGEHSIYRDESLIFRGCIVPSESLAQINHNRASKPDWAIYAY